MTETAQRRWSEDWYRWKTGADCPYCLAGRPETMLFGGPESVPLGIRFFAGSVLDAYLLNGKNAPGSTITIWRGRHVNDPIEMSEAELTAYVLEQQLVARALDEQYQPIKISYVTIGSHVPHLHTVIVLRYDDDEAPNAFLLWKWGTERPSEDLMGQAEALRSLVASSSSD